MTATNYKKANVAEGVFKTVRNRVQESVKQWLALRQVISVRVQPQWKSVLCRLCGLIAIAVDFKKITSRYITERILASLTNFPSNSMC